ncbi:MAG: hypothetical protein ABWZ83_10160, partial [Mesorhizobium sp.]
ALSSIRAPQSGNRISQEDVIVLPSPEIGTAHAQDQSAQTFQGERCMMTNDYQTHVAFASTVEMLC